MGSVFLSVECRPGRAFAVTGGRRDTRRPVGAPTGVASSHRGRPLPRGRGGAAQIRQRAKPAQLSLNRLHTPERSVKWDQPFKFFTFVFLSNGEDKAFSCSPRTQTGVEVSLG